jgi:predicted AAA+ superfamily ATPase
MIERTLDLSKIVSEKSTFLFGPRQVGKSTLLKATCPAATFVDLLSPPQFRLLSARPEVLEDLAPASGLVVIDEIQSLPELLDVVHRLLESRPALKFVLTGSSARKLRRGGVNLLGGRARRHFLLPLTTHELATAKAGLNWLTLLEQGGLPSLLTSVNPFEDLDAYVGLYLREEIQAEALVRSVHDFSRFLNVAGSCNGQLMNFEKLASDVGVSAKVLRSYVDILVDTLVADVLLPLNAAAKRKVVSMPKLYFFDIGVANSLKGLARVRPGTESFGQNLEHLVYLELKAHREYRRLHCDISFWRTQSKLEVDFVVASGNSLLGIEVKGTEFPDADDYKGLKEFAKEFPAARRILVCNTALRYTRADGIEVFPAGQFFEELWADKIVPVGLLS